MALVQSKQVVAKYAFPTFEDSRDLIAISAEYVVPTGTLAVNDVIEMGLIPANSTVVDAVLHFTAGGASRTCDFGRLSGTYGDATAATGQARTCGTEYGSAVSVASAGVARTAVNQTGAGVTNDTTAFGLKVTGGTFPAAMVIRAHLLVRPEIVGLV